MPVEVSSARVSGRQRSLFSQVRFGSSPADAIDAFLELVRDDDLRTGRETLHPDWIPFYEQRREHLEHMVPAEILGAMDEVFRTDPIDAAVRQMDPSTLRIAFLFGAGASNPEPSGIPVTRELLSHLFERARRANRDDVLRVAEFCNENKIDNIEDLLTALQIATFCSRSPTILKMTDYLLYRNVGEERGRRARVPEGASIAFIQDTFQILFGSLSGIMLPARPNPCHEAVADFAKAHQGCAVITTNYDCCIDLALGKVGKDFSYRIPFHNRPELDESPDPTPLIKLHGSLNWFYCETCQSVQLIDIRRAADDFDKDAVPFPVIAICPKCSGQRRGLAVPPLAMKFDFYPPLTPLLGFAQDAFNGSDIIMAVGYSFADADLYISRMISKSMQASPDQKLLIVDRSASVVEKMRRKLSSTIPNFDQDRVLAASGDCVEVLPRFLRGELVMRPDSQAEEEIAAQISEMSSREPKVTKDHRRRSLLGS